MRAIWPEMEGGGGGGGYVYTCMHIAYILHWSIHLSHNFNGIRIHVSLNCSTLRHHWASVLWADWTRQILVCFIQTLMLLGIKPG